MEAQSKHNHAASYLFYAIAPITCIVFIFVLIYVRKNTKSVWHQLIPALFIMRQITAVICMILTDQVLFNTDLTQERQISITKWACAILTLSNICFFFAHWLFCSKYWPLAHMVSQMNTNMGTVRKFFYPTVFVLVCGFIILSCTVQGQYLSKAKEYQIVNGPQSKYPADIRNILETSEIAMYSSILFDLVVISIALVRINSKLKQIPSMDSKKMTIIVHLCFMLLLLGASIQQVITEGYTFQIIYDVICFLTNLCIAYIIYLVNGGKPNGIKSHNNAFAHQSVGLDSNCDSEELRCDIAGTMVSRTKSEGASVIDLRQTNTSLENIYEDPEELQSVADSETDMQTLDPEQMENEHNQSMSLPLVGESRDSARIALDNSKDAQFKHLQLLQAEQINNKNDQKFVQFYEELQITDNLAANMLGFIAHGTLDQFRATSSLSTSIRINDRPASGNLNYQTERSESMASLAGQVLYQSDRGESFNFNEKQNIVDSERLARMSEGAIPPSPKDQQDENSLRLTLD